LVKRLDAADIAFAELNEIDALARHPHLNRVSIETIAGTVSVPRPAAVHDQELRRYGPVPALGQHTEAILSEFCGKGHDDE
jgi:formyl-CoA transferase